MITLNDCISILDENAESPACVRFLSLAAKPAKMKKEGGFRATYELKSDGICIHLEYIEQAWRVLALQFYGVKESDFLVTPENSRSRWIRRRNVVACMRYWALRVQPVETEKSARMEL